MRLRFPRLRFSLLALLTLVAVCAGVLHWLRGPLNRTREQEAAVDRLQRENTWLLVAWEPAREPWARWLEQQSGTECRNVVGLEMMYRCAPDDAAELRHFPQLRELGLLHGITDDKALETVAELKQLESLQVHLWLDVTGPSELYNSKLPQAPRNEGVRHLAKLPKLRHLLVRSAVRFEPPNVWHRYVNDEGLGPVLAAAPLEEINISGTAATMDSLRPLLKKQTLKVVTLSAPFAADVDELLADPTLQWISIKDLPKDVVARNSQRLSDYGGGAHKRMHPSMRYDRYELGKPVVSH